MPIVVTCPSCQTKLKVPDQSAGKMVKCPKCSNAISVPATGNEQVPATPAAPAAPPTMSAPVPDAGAAATTGDAAPKKSRKGLYIGLGVGAILLLSCCCLGGGGGLVAYFFLGAEKNDKVTKENFGKLHKNDNLSQVEAVLGQDKGKEAKAEDIRKAFKESPKGDEIIGKYGKNLLDGAIYYWRNGDDWIFIVFDKAPKTKDGKPVSDAKSQTGIWVSATGGAVSSEEKPLP